MLNRRRFIASATAATGVLGASRGWSHSNTLAPEYMPREVDLGAPAPAGELHVIPDTFALYWTLGGTRAMRYSVGIGREGLYEPGTFFIGAKKEWPAWTPTPAMIEREPDKYAQYADGMPGGPNNPLGARALYLFTPERGDTFLRIHGTNDASTIGKAVSNGCARLVNDQIKELYEKVPEDTTVILYEKNVGTPQGDLGQGNLGAPTDGQAVSEFDRLYNSGFGLNGRGSTL